jgi:hypothetical protein
MKVGNTLKEIHDRMSNIYGKSLPPNKIPEQAAEIKKALI